MSNQTNTPSPQPTLVPTFDPTTFSQAPTYSLAPTYSQSPTLEPTISQAPTYSQSPTLSPTSEPTFLPTYDPTISPTSEPTSKPTSSPTLQPTSRPTRQPTIHPTRIPTKVPTFHPTHLPVTLKPTKTHSPMAPNNSTISSNDVKVDGPSTALIAGVVVVFGILFFVIIAVCYRCGVFLRKKRPAPTSQYLQTNTIPIATATATATATPAYYTSDRNSQFTPVYNSKFAEVRYY